MRWFKGERSTEEEGVTAMWTSWPVSSLSYSLGREGDCPVGSTLLHAVSGSCHSPAEDMRGLRVFTIATLKNYTAHILFHSRGRVSLKRLMMMMRAIQDQNSLQYM